MVSYFFTGLFHAVFKTELFTKLCDSLGDFLPNFKINNQNLILYSEIVLKIEQF